MGHSIFRKTRVAMTNEKTPILNIEGQQVRKSPLDTSLEFHNFANELLLIKESLCGHITLKAPISYLWNLNYYHDLYFVVHWDKINSVFLTRLCLNKLPRLFRNTSFLRIALLNSLSQSPFHKYRIKGNHQLKTKRGKWVYDKISVGTVAH